MVADLAQDVNPCQSIAPVLQHHIAQVLQTCSKDIWLHNFILAKSQQPISEIALHASCKTCPDTRHAKFQMHKTRKALIYNLSGGRSTRI